MLTEVPATPYHVKRGKAVTSKLIKLFPGCGVMYPHSESSVFDLDKRAESQQF